MSIRLALLCAVASSACAHSHYRALPPGAPLAVVPVMSKVPITRDTYVTDASGVPIATETTVLGYKDVVSGFAFKQGDDYIDEQDFYRLAKDRDGLDAVERARKTGRFRNRLGIGLMIASTATAIAVPIAAGRSTAPYAIGQWFVAFPVGLGLTFFGKRPFDSHVLPANRAFQALGDTPPVWAAQPGR